MDFVRIALDEERDRLIASWSPFIDCINYFMDQKGFDPLTTEEAGKLAEELEWHMKNGPMEELGVMMPTIAGEAGNAAMCKQQIARLKKEQPDETPE